jgi:hexosaminidase
MKMKTYDMHLSRARAIALLLLIIGFTSCKKSAPVADVRIIPRPERLEMMQGTFDIGPDTRWIVTADDARLRRGVEIMLGEFQKATAFPLKLEVDTHATDVPNALIFSLVNDDKLMGAEGYTLSINAHSVRVTGSTPAGVFHGMQTLRQLFPPDLEDSTYQAEAWSLPCLEISDKPRFAWRGDLLDVSRHFLPVEFINKNIDYLARYKMNVFHWHLTDDQGWRIESKKFPQLTTIGAWRVNHEDKDWWGRDPQKPGEKATYGGYFTQAEIRDVVQYAQDRFITVVPEIDMPGHSRSAIASIPAVSCDGGPYTVATGGVASENTLCPGKEETFQYIDELLGEILPLFPGEYFHVGGDECNKSSWEKCPYCQKRIRSEHLKDEHELQSYFIRRVERIVEAHGKKLIGWDEILEGGLAPNAAVMSWRGERGGIQAARMGHNVVMTPANFCYLDLKQGDPELEPEMGYSQARLTTVYSYDPVPSELTEDESRHILGVQGNLWGEFIPNEKKAHYMLFPRLLAVAEVGWTPKQDRVWEEFMPRLEYNLQRLKNLGIGYAPSMYNVEISPQASEKPGTVKIVLATENGRAPIRYTLNGSNPTVASPAYDQPLLIDSTSVIRAAPVVGDSIGRITTRTQKLHKATGIIPTFGFAPSDSLGNSAASLLTDCIRGTTRRDSRDWMMFEGNDFIATVDLGGKQHLSDVIVGCLERPSRRTFFPTRIEVFGSVDGSEYQTLGSVAVSAEKRRQSSTRDFRIEFPKKEFRYVRVQATSQHVAPKGSARAGEPAIIAVDELIVE